MSNRIDIDAVRAAEFPAYLVGKDGSVWTTNLSQGRSRTKPKLMRTKRKDSRFSSVVLCNHDERRRVRVDRLVLETFCGPPPFTFSEPIHIDFDADNNNIENLTWSTPIVPNVSLEFGHWLAGFTDGEGSFGIGSNGDTRCCTFCIKLRDDDLAILDHIACSLLIGTIYRTTNSNPNWGNVAEWSVRDKSGCFSVVLFFETFPLRGKKARDFAIWKQAVHWWVNEPPGDRWHGSRDWSVIDGYKRELECGRRYAMKGGVA